MKETADRTRATEGSLERADSRASGVLIAIPALDEAETIESVLKSLPSTLPDLGDVEVLVVDDGSTDNTADLARARGALVISHARTSGVGRAFQTAVEQALKCGAEILVTMDADGQFSPEQIPALLEPIVKNRADVVTGSRFLEGRPANMPIVKYIGNKMMAYMIRAFTGTDLRDASCGFRAYNREALLQLNLFGGFTYTQETLLDMAFKGARIVEVPVTVRYFDERKSRVAGNVLRYALNTTKIILRAVRDFKPFRFYGGIGLAVFLAGLTLDLWMLWYWLSTGSFSPYKFVGFGGVALNIVGILLGGLGLLADMLERIRINQERILYYHKKGAYGGSRDEADRR